MELNRRELLRRAVLGGGAASVGAVPAAADELFDRPAKEMPPKAVGMLYDSTLCVGCRACVAACKQANGMPAETPAALAGWNEGTWDAAEDISGKTLNVIRVFRDGKMSVKDRETDGYAFVKRHCLHCVDPSCVSVCPVSAMRKDPETGIVSYNPDACIGCRYCVYGCPFGVPQFDYSDPFGRINKCQMCAHLQAKGEIPACCDVCPTGASLFGPVDLLHAESERRLALAPGAVYDYPRGDIRQHRPVNTRAAAEYKKDVYGRTEVGGTQVRYLAAVPFVKLGLPKLPSRSFARLSEGMQHTLYKHMLAPALLLLGLAGLAWRSIRAATDDEKQAEKEGRS
jgi:Fe-S-cluster-containing dehydrogenase component